MQKFSFKRFLVLVLLLAAGTGMGLGLAYYLKKPSTGEITTAEAEAPQSKASEKTLALEVESSFGNHLYPSLILSFGGVASEFRKCITLRFSHAEVGEKCQIKLASDLFETPFIKTLTLDSEDLVMTPDVPWNFKRLREVKQVRPETLVVSVVTSSGKRLQTSCVVTVHPINEVVSKLFDSETGQWQDTSICFAAYVNEGHPLINQIIQEAALKTSVTRFSGYEFGLKSVKDQMQAVWETLAARGLNYSDLATTSSEVSGVSSQYVRFVNESLKDQGANCVDASLLFVSIFRRIGLRPVLIFVPGHCFIGVYDKEQGGEIITLETTLLSSSTFAQAESAGDKEMQMASAMMGQTGFSYIDLSLARDSGVLPIESN